ncbi:MAG TPA: helix-turn-helix domain-containing protein [Sulfuricurvum sp.]|nr:MAG: hypothetical protein B7Y30_00385 [Campylobacterales bacterium 16-40-21]OZA03202.1 MAG: hypothetical protein B7X89_06250 [Sulfuricurvum sp. 17-40-25]HQS66989.1 helix-turn-helix domain-containing protein [Sulfuricurvum sp.]HQT37492.1 helix-turn-helix domain-containing protein [Sulfuricurvum sp.]
MKRYIAIDMFAIRENNLSFEKWALLENIYFLSNNNYHACFASKPTLADYLLISRRQIFKIISELELAGLIEKNELGHLRVTQKWVDLSSDTSSAKNAPPVQNLHQNSAKIALPSVQKMHPKKDITKRENKIDKKNIQKSSPTDVKVPLIIPRSAVNVFLIQSFINYRKELGYPFTQTALNHFVQKLEEFRHQNEDIEKMIETAIISGWRNVFPNKKPWISAQEAKRAKGEDMQTILNENGYSTIFEAIEDMHKKRS